VGFVVILAVATLYSLILFPCAVTTSLSLLIRIRHQSPFHLPIFIQLQSLLSLLIRILCPLLCRFLHFHLFLLLRLQLSLLIRILLPVCLSIFTSAARLHLQLRLLVSRIIRILCQSSQLPRLISLFSSFLIAIQILLFLPLRAPCQFPQSRIPPSNSNSLSIDILFDLSSTSLCLWDNIYAIAVILYWINVISREGGSTATHTRNPLAHSTFTR